MHKLLDYNFRVLNSSLPLVDRAAMYPADFGIKGTPMALRQNRGQHVTSIDATTGREHYIITCDYFQLHGSEGERAEPPLKEVQHRPKQPIISAGERIGDKRVVSLPPLPQLRKQSRLTSEHTHVSDRESKDLGSDSDRPLIKINNPRRAKPIDIEDLSDEGTPETGTSPEAMAAYIENLEQQVVRSGAWGKGLLYELNKYDRVESTAAEGKEGYKEMQRIFRNGRDA